jgi:hypothetical protein
MTWPLCIICGQPVTCDQGRAHYSCLGMCQQCYQRPAAGPGNERRDRCANCQGVTDGQD